MIQNWIKKHQLISFFVLAYAIMTGAVVASIIFRPGQPDHLWSFIWFLYAFSPTYSAIIISFVIGGWSELKRLFSGYTRWKVGLRWYFAAAFLFVGPLAFALVFILLRHKSSGLQAGMTVAGLAGQLIFTLFSGPLAEEAGWRGFALPRLQQKHTALVSSLILGVVWCCWHIPLFFLPGSSQQSIPFPIYLMLVVTLGVYFTWLYNNTKGSLIITVLAHLSFNMSGGFIAGTLGLLPPMVLYIAAGTMLVLATVSVVLVFGSEHLSKKPVSELPA